ncbi:MAG: SGNH/GDSL hydrolase family protein [Clostridia bacterium]|nr:SGNH/GDSL hydrolase family protein [Clostridia bacterium]
MNEFTYEASRRGTKYETYEWDNTWISRANEHNLPRVLYVGDSISVEVRRSARDKVGDKLQFDQFSTSKGLDNPYFKDMLGAFMRQEERRDIILFNNGLHGWHLDDETEYKTLYEEMLAYLISEGHGASVAAVLTTFIRDKAQNERVVKRNLVVRDIAARMNIPVVDLYSVSFANAEHLTADGVHYRPEGYSVLADEVIRRIGEFAPGLPD